MRTLSDQELIDVSHHWRRQALGGSAAAQREAMRHEVELRRRFGNDGDDALPLADLPIAVLEAAEEFVIATADAATPSAAALRELLHNLRSLLEMDIAFVAEFVDGRKVYRHVDLDAVDEARVEVGDSAPLETTLCQRVVDGRLPQLLADARAEPSMAELAAVKALDIGAYLSTPVLMRDGSTYGTLCCISHAPRSALGSRQIDSLRYVARIVAAELEKQRS